MSRDNAFTLTDVAEIDLTHTCPALEWQRQEKHWLKTLPSQNHLASRTSRCLRRLGLRCGMLEPERMRGRGGRGSWGVGARVGEGGSTQQAGGGGAMAQWREWRLGRQAEVAAGQGMAHGVEPEQGEVTHVAGGEGQEG